LKRYNKNLVKNEKQITETDTVSGKSWKHVTEEQQWDEFLAWCKEQENGPHE